MQPDDFYILIEPISEVEARDVVDFKRSKIVAKITLKQYQELVKKNQSKCCSTKLVSKKLKSKPKPRPPSLSVNQKEHLAKHGVSQKKSKQTKFGLPLIIPGKKVERTVSFKSRTLPKTPDSKQEPAKPVSSATGAQRSPLVAASVLPKSQKLIDLIPPDVDVFGLDMEQLYLNTPETDESDCDSVSYFGSDDSY